MRKIIARRLLESKQTIPAAYFTRDSSLTALTSLRETLKAADQRASVNDFVIKAVAAALRGRMGLCAGWDAEAEEPLFWDTVDISIAVATPAGLITPIVTSADEKSLDEISKTVKDLARAPPAASLVAMRRVCAV